MKLEKLKLKNLLNDNGKEIQTSFKKALINSEDWELVKGDFETALLQYVNTGDSEKLNNLISSKYLNSNEFNKIEFFDSINQVFFAYMIRDKGDSDKYRNSRNIDNSQNNKNSNKSNKSEISRIYNSLNMENPFDIVEEGKKTILSEKSISSVINDGKKDSKDLLEEMKKGFKADMEELKRIHKEEIKRIENPNGNPKDPKKLEEPDEPEL